jgi:hypothetical protein
MRTIRSLIFLTLAVILASPGATLAAWYAKFDGVDGSSQVKDHKGWVNFVSVLPALGPDTTSGPGTLIVVVMDTKATPKLLEAATKGKVFMSVRLGFTDGDPGQPAVYLKWRLYSVRVTSYSISGAGMELALSFEKLLPAQDDPGVQEPQSLTGPGESGPPRVR